MKPQVLLIDDSADDRVLFRRILDKTSLDVEVLEARDAEVGMQLLAERAIDCVVLDYHLGKSTGLDFLHSLSQRQSPKLLPVIMLTGAGNETIAIDSLKAGATDYIVKHRMTPEALQRAIRHALKLARASREKLQAEQALFESEAQFRDLVEGSVQGIVISRDGVPLFANAKFAQMFGYEHPESIIALGSLDSIYTADELELIKKRRAARRAGVEELADFSFKGLRKDGSERYFETRARQISWQGQQAVQSTIIDVTGRRRAEEALELRTAAAEAATDGIVIVDALSSDFPIIYASGSFLALTGYTNDEVLGRNCRFLQGPETSSEVIEQMRNALAAGWPLQHEILNYRKDGKTFWNLLRIEPLNDSAGKLKYFVATLTDITTRKIVEQQLYSEKERLQVTLHSIGDAVITTDSEGFVEFMNPIAESLTGWRAQEAKGLHLDRIFEIVNEVTKEAVANPITLCLEKNKVTGLPDNIELIGRSGARHSVQDSAAPILKEDGTLLGAVLVFQDVTEARVLAKQVEYQACHDSLTGLLNRPEFEQRIDNAISSARVDNKEHVLLFLDLDNFKIVNDAAGHIAGDALLKQIALQLSDQMRTRDSLARLGGDEFSVLLESCPLHKAREIANNLVETVRRIRFTWEESVYEVGVSIGLVPITAEEATSAQILTKADVACYAAKDQGRNRVVAYHAEDGESARRHREILRAAGLRNALEKDQFLLFAQKIIPLDSSKNPSPYYEVLLRLQDESGTCLTPGAFIPAAERYKLMTDIDRWVIDTTLHQYATLFGPNSDARLAINLSGNSLADESLLEFVLEQFASSKVPCSRVCFEITETAAISNLMHATRLVRAFKDMGCSVALDDFGSGLSSFTYLKQFPIDYLKIDGSFMRGELSDPTDFAMVKSMHDIGKVMGIETIAEWVESTDTLERLKTIGVDYVQGFVNGIPGPIAEVVGADPGG